MLLAIRHGDTKSNDESDEKFRTPDIALEPEGLKHIMDTANFLKKVSLVNKDKPILTSPLPRAVQSAHEIASTVGTTIEPHDELRDWDLGSLMGTPVKKGLPTVFKHLDNPDVPLPNGESYNSYFNRTYPLLKSLVESHDLHTVVTHNRTMTLLHALTETKGEPPPVSYLKEKGPVAPAGMMIVGPDWSQINSDGFPRTYA